MKLETRLPKPQRVRRAWATKDGDIGVVPKGDSKYWWYRLSLDEAEDLQRQLLRAILKARTCKP